MELKVSSGGIGSPKRDMFRSTRGRNQKTMMSNLMEAIEEMNTTSRGGVVSETKEDGVVRMKIKVRKEDLRQMLQVMKNVNKSSSSTHNNNTSSTSTSSSSSSLSMSLEQRLNLLRRKHLLRGNNIGGKSNGSSSRGRGCPRSWSPVLQSIPEEL
ncbi:hypothetical protein JRO89_XS02G0010200 [Xanthoceras sorbifolium]|uniref:Uncharacterized protein n=1 Tax=Xanthoceras sorbifolium TaxID=99658 RepID=A0ABQ8IDU8_9ROSI|nr:hypothetical protein JRO89_XS02G0010200 [Xanthoceras sorbifolium]